VAYKLAVLSIAVAIVSLIVSLAVLIGFKKNIRDKIFGFESHLQVSQFSMSSNVFDHYPISKKSDLFVNGKTNVPEIKDIKAFAYQKGIIHANEQVFGIMLKGVEEGYETLAFNKTIKKGDFISFSDTARSNEVVLSTFVADKMDLHVGDPLHIYFYENNRLKPRKLVVSGLYETFLEEFDQRLVLCDLKLIQQIKGWQDTLVGGYEIFLHKHEQLDTTEAKVFDLLDMHMQVEKVTHKYAYLFDWLSLLDQNVVVFVAILMLIAFFNITSVMYIIALERTNMIGVLKGLGGTDRLINLIFLRIGAGLAFKGLFIGNAISFLFCYLQDQFHLVPLNPTNYYMSYVPIEWYWDGFIWVNVAAFVFICISLYIPIRIATKVSPLRSIRFH